MGTRGPRSRLSLEDIVDAGVAVAEETGLNRLSMRRVATRLGVGTMTLYTHLPGKAELVELMIDRVYGERRRPDPHTSWRTQLEVWATASWDLYRRHPWVLEANIWRMPLAPNVLDSSEAAYRALHSAGVEATLVIGLVHQVEAFVSGMARGYVADDVELQRTGVSMDDYWAARESFWGTYFDPGRYPTMLALWEADGFELGTDDFPVALARLLDGIGSLVERR